VQYIAFTVVVVSGLAAGTYLAVHGHPWFALLAFLVIQGASVSVSGDPKKRKKERKLSQVESDST